MIGLTGLGCSEPSFAIRARKPVSSIFRCVALPIQRRVQEARSDIRKGNPSSGLLAPKKALPLHTDGLLPCAEPSLILIQTNREFRLTSVR